MSLTSHRRHCRYRDIDDVDSISSLHRRHFLDADIVDLFYFEDISFDAAVDIDRPMSIILIKYCVYMICIIFNSVFCKHPVLKN